MKKSLLMRALPLCLAAFVSQNVLAQKTPQQLTQLKTQILSNPAIKTVELSDTRQTPAMLVLNPAGGVYDKSKVPVLLSQVLNLRTGTDFLVPGKNQAPSQGIEVVEYRQYFKGIKVDKAGFKAMLKNGQTALLNGAWYDMPASLSVQPAITEAQALAYAKARVGAQKYAWENIQDIMQKTADARTRSTLQKEYDEYLPKAELVFVKDGTNEGATVVRLAYKFNIYAVKPLSRAFIYVDAIDARILLVDKIIKHVDDEAKHAAPQPLPSVNALVYTRYGGRQMIKTKQVSGNDPNSGLLLQSSHPTTGSDVGYVPGSATYVLVDDTRGNGVVTYDLNALGGTPVSLAPAYTVAKAFTDVDNNWDSVEHSRGGAYGGANEAENDDIAWDAHWGAEVVYDYWLAKHNRRSYDGADATIKSYIHYGPAYDNAFWNGSAMTYGDGSGNALTGFKALTSLDVCGHEIGHGVCSNTSDLVYEKESGGMNEGFSDIWAACIEHFAMVRTASTVPANKYRPYYIGEQISFDPNSPLRRMDAPKAQTNPDTYRGQYWVNVNCTPSLANDQCGVHTNSGVLNHWFFLLSAGSKLGTRPAGINNIAYYFADSDDELRDDTTTGFNSVPYRVNGVGFDVAEQITFITETLLTPTATYAEARSVSIEVAKAFSGDPCSAVVKSVTDAWFAVGMGDAFPASCTPTFGLINTTAINIAEGAFGIACNRTKTVTLPVLVPANTTLAISTTGTATAGKDFILSTASLTNNTASPQAQNITVTINDDAVIDRADGAAETVVVNLSGSGVTNGAITINIDDDDVLPRLGSDSLLLINETFTGAPNNFTEPAGWAEFRQIAEVYPAVPDPQASGQNQWGLFDNTIAIAYKPLATSTSGTGRTYNTTSSSQTIIYRTQPVDARGLSNLQIKFDYAVGGESDPAGTAPEEFPKFDFVELVYSEDNGTTWRPLDMSPRYQLNSPVLATGTFRDSLPTQLNNKQFLLGFRWTNDPLLGNAISVSIDNLTLKATPVKIESDVNDVSNESLVQSEDAYFYSTRDRGIITRINQQDAVAHGCVTATVTKAGSSTFILYTDGLTNNRVADKFISVTPTQNAGTGSYTISLYLTETEIAALEQAAGVNRTQFSIYKTVADYTQASAGNTTKMAAGYSPITVNSTAVGGIFTATFSNGFSGFAIGAASSVALAVNCVDFKATRGSGNVALQWKVASDAPGSNYEIERSTDGLNFSRSGAVTGNGGAVYSFADNNIAGLRGAYYRIKQIDAGGAFRYLCTVLFVSFDGRNVLTVGSIYPNPGKGAASVNVTLNEARRLRIEYVNAAGQVLQGQTESLPAGATLVNLRVGALASGSYLVRFTDGEGRILNTQLYIQQ